MDILGHSFYPAICRVMESLNGSFLASTTLGLDFRVESLSADRVRFGPGPEYPSRVSIFINSNISWSPCI
jgi:hypothetical protein